MSLSRVIQCETEIGHSDTFFVLFENQYSPNVVLVLNSSEFLFLFRTILLEIRKETTLKRRKISKDAKRKNC